MARPQPDLTLDMKFNPVVYLQCYSCKAQTPVKEEHDLNLFTQVWITSHLHYNPDCAGGFRIIQSIEANLHAEGDEE